MLKLRQNRVRAPHVPAPLSLLAAPHHIQHRVAQARLHPSLAHARQHRRPVRIPRPRRSPRRASPWPWPRPAQAACLPRPRLRTKPIGRIQQRRNIAPQSQAAHLFHCAMRHGNRAMNSLRRFCRRATSPAIHNCACREIRHTFPKACSRLGRSLAAVDTPDR